LQEVKVLASRLTATVYIAAFYNFKKVLT
jgi:hypothetical protein